MLFYLPDLFALLSRPRLTPHLTPLLSLSLSPCEQRCFPSLVLERPSLSRLPCFPASLLRTQASQRSGGTLPMSKMSTPTASSRVVPLALTAHGRRSTLTFPNDHLLICFACSPPPIDVSANDTLYVHALNSLDEITTLHHHGMYFTNASWYDGALGVSQWLVIFLIWETRAVAAHACFLTTMRSTQWYPARRVVHIRRPHQRVGAMGNLLGARPCHG